MNGGYTGTSKRMVPNELPGSGKPIEFTGYWKSLRSCSKCGKKMWENGKETHCIGEFEEITDENGEESNAENVKRESNGDL